MLKRLAKELCVYILAGVVIWFCIITISGGEGVKLGISEAVDRCMNIIIPSLFVFMALSQILVSSGLYYCVSMPFYPISRFIIGIPPQLFFVFLLGNTAGYPVGVKLLSDLCQRKIISQRTAKIMSCFCCCGGPAFYSGTVGLAVFGCTGAGIAVFVSILAANFLTALVLGRAINEVRECWVQASYKPPPLRWCILVCCLLKTCVCSRSFIRYRSFGESRTCL